VVDIGDIIVPRSMTFAEFRVLLHQRYVPDWPAEEYVLRVCMCVYDCGMIVSCPVCLSDRMSDIHALLCCVCAQSCADGGGTQRAAVLYAARYIHILQLRVCYVILCVCTCVYVCVCVCGTCVYHLFLLCI